MTGIETADHHGSHRDLIWQGDESAPTLKVDAIIVPTARKVAYLKEAAAAALALGCPLVTLHSGRWTSAFAAAAQLDPAVDLIAIDVPEPAGLRLPSLATSSLLAGTMFERRTDVSTKRNLGLVLSHALRWKRVVFLDDDIRVPNPADLSLAVGLLGSYSAVGLGIGGFPDNSMVCHAFREAGGWQETFIGGGALAVGVKRNRSFFPNVYNEDWFFVLDAGKRLQSVATVGQALQYPYDPYRVERARGEEFGDVLAEGTFWLLDQGKPASDGDLAHWRDFLAHRQQFIAQVQGMVESTTSIDANDTGADGGGAEGGARPVRAHTPATVRGLHEGTGHRPGSVAAPHPADTAAATAVPGRSSQIADRQGQDAVDLVHQGHLGERAPRHQKARTAHRTRTRARVACGPDGRTSGHHPAASPDLGASRAHHSRPGVAATPVRGSSSPVSSACGGNGEDRSGQPASPRRRRWSRRHAPAPAGSSITSGLAAPEPLLSRWEHDACPIPARH